MKVDKVVVERFIAVGDAHHWPLDRDKSLDYETSGVSSIYGTAAPWFAGERIVALN
ncbi:hypothetical protein KSF_071510 [Reticulibacter mediterranei]|uniref:Uncharacterized protein n=2 Tax=Reticulibacter mediterranei TaxID=2778369 RepID=A0A8J3N627_9CHLR|nr:hypothetical protein KSF_071510 [Reticulibacter mediterranei]